MMFEILFLTMVCVNFESIDCKMACNDLPQSSLSVSIYLGGWLKVLPYIDDDDDDDDDEEEEEEEEEFFMCFFGSLLAGFDDEIFASNTIDDDYYGEDDDDNALMNMSNTTPLFHVMGIRNSLPRGACRDLNRLTDFHNRLY
eukprot:6476449-Amphidinium_carterae.1